MHYRPLCPCIPPSHRPAPLDPADLHTCALTPLGPAIFHACVSVPQDLAASMHYRPPCPCTHSKPASYTPGPTPASLQPASLQPWDRQPSIPAPLQDSGLHEFLHPRSPRPHFLGPNPRSHVYLILVPTPLSSHTPIPCIPLCSRPCTSMHPSIPSSRDLPVSIHYGPTRPCIPSKSASCTPGPCSPPHPYPCTPGTPSRIPAPPPSQHSALLDPAALHIHVPA